MRSLNPHDGVLLALDETLAFFKENANAGGTAVNGNAGDDCKSAVIHTEGKEVPVLLSDVVVHRQENDAGGVHWRLELGISRAEPDQMEWTELDELIQAAPELQFRVNDETSVPVDEWFGETDSRIGDELPDISLAVDLTWHGIEGPVSSVEALWVDDTGVQSLGHLLVRPLDYVPVQRRPDVTAAQVKGNGCGASILLLAVLLCVGCYSIAIALSSAQ